MRERNPSRERQQLQRSGHNRVRRHNNRLLPPVTLARVRVARAMRTTHGVKASSGSSNGPHKQTPMRSSSPTNPRRSTCTHRRHRGRRRMPLPTMAHICNDSGPCWPHNSLCADTARVEVPLDQTITTAPHATESPNVGSAREAAEPTRRNARVISCGIGSVPEF